MKKIILFVVFASSIFFAQAQIGISASYTQLDSKTWHEHINNLRTGGTEINDFSAWQVGVDYWFRLPKHRVEFLPQLSYAPYKIEETDAFDMPFKLDLKSYQFSLNTNIYILDFMGDCDCPTFSKQDPIFKKGLFIQIAPGITYFDQTVEARGDNYSTTNMAFHLGLGLGLDIGISDFITITPFVRAKQHFNADWENLNAHFTGHEAILPDENKTNILQLEAGVHLSLRWKK